MHESGRLISDEIKIDSIGRRKRSNLDDATSVDTLKQSKELKFLKYLYSEAKSIRVYDFESKSYSEISDPTLNSTQICATKAARRALVS